MPATEAERTFATRLALNIQAIGGSLLPVLCGLPPEQVKIMCTTTLLQWSQQTSLHGSFQAQGLALAS